MDESSFFQRIITWFVTLLFTHFKPTVKFIKDFPDAITPIRREDESIGFDLYAPNQYNFGPGQTLVVDTGIIFEFPLYLSAFIWDKSSLVVKQNFHVLGGVIDPGYRNNIGVILQNTLLTNNVLEKGAPVGQILFQPAIIPRLEIGDEIDSTKTLRGKRGFGGEHEKYLEIKKQKYFRDETTMNNRID